jgi:two-component system sensor histidine kinase AlgZ
VNANNFLPDFCASQVVFFVVLVTELLAFTLALATPAFPQNFWMSLALISVFMQWVALFSIAALCWCRGWLNRMNVRVVAIAAFILTQLITLLASSLTLWVAPYIVYMMNFESRAGIHFILRNTAISSILCLIILRYFYIQQQWRQNVQAEARSQLQALQARIRPHFLFNSMNTIASLVRTQPLQAEEMVLDLADLFRAALLRKDKVTLQEELDSARRYLRIEQKRLGPRLQVEWLLSSELPLSVSVPALILQPLLENAVYHGIQSLLDGGTICIEITIQNSHLFCRISNPLGTPGAARAEQGQGMAQENTRRRLALTYGEQSYLRTHAGEHHYKVEIMIPLVKDKMPLVKENNKYDGNAL